MPNITITAEEYHDLLDKSFQLECLERGGVDNWEWYDESLRPYRNMIRDRENEEARENAK